MSVLDRTVGKSRALNTQNVSVHSSNRDENSVDGGDSTSLLEESKEHDAEGACGNAEQVAKDDIGNIFDKVQMPGLILRNLKVKKSKQSIQDAFSQVNWNMQVIDGNMKDLLFLLKDLT